jgi:hypothetical protein
MTGAPRFTAADERLHPHDPWDWSWNESWFFSWIDLDGGPAGFFRVGVLPNQQRAMLWNFVYVDGRWLGIEESRLAFADCDLTEGIGYDRWGLQFAWAPEPAPEGARFTTAGDFLVRSGDHPGGWVPLSLELTCRATSPCLGSGDPPDNDASPHPVDRFEQSLEATGTLIVDGVRHGLRAGAHRDRSWGPRDWRIMFTLGDAQHGDHQLYFVGSPAYGRGSGYLRDGASIRHLTWVDDALEYDDAHRTIAPGTMGFEDRDGNRIDVAVMPVAPSVAFDMDHTCPEPEHWLYYRTLIEARVPGWETPCRGWFEASRYGV